MEARLQGADLTLARLEEANLMGARLEGANLGGVRLDGANLEGARLEGANLQVARLDGANLSGADFRRSNWLGALKRPALAWGADFRGAQELTQAQLDNVIGDDGTLLPEGNAPDTGEPFHVWNCWETPAPELDQIIAAVGGRSADPAVLRVALLCRPDNPRRKAGTPLALDAPYPEGHPLADRY
jgi:hypothetical protein